MLPAVTSTELPKSLIRIFLNIYFMEHKRALCAYFNPLQINYTHVHMPDGQQWEVLGNAVLYSFIQKSAAVRFGSLNTLLTLPVEKDCFGKVKPRSQGKTGDIILLNEI